MPRAQRSFLMLIALLAVAGCTAPPMPPMPSAPAEAETGLAMHGTIDMGFATEAGAVANADLSLSLRFP